MKTNNAPINTSRQGLVRRSGYLLGILVAASAGGGCMCAMSPGSCEARAAQTPANPSTYSWHETSGGSDQ